MDGAVLSKLNNLISSGASRFTDGGKYVMSGTPTTPDAGFVFVTIQVVEVAILADIVGNVTNLVGHSLPVGTIIAGVFTSVTVASGKVVAYMMESYPAKVLRPDVIYNDYNYDLDINYVADSVFNAKIKKVLIGDVALRPYTDYELSDGNLKLKPRGGNVLLRTPSTPLITVKATGYEDSKVLQTINAGCVLETIPGAVAVYSNRKLFNHASLSENIRKSSDESFQDFGFSGTAIDQKALLKWTSGSNAYVTCMYNQIDNDTSNLIQSDATKQPTTVDYLGYVSNYFDGATNMLVAQNVSPTLHFGDTVTIAFKFKVHSACTWSGHILAKNSTAIKANTEYGIEYYEPEDKLLIYFDGAEVMMSTSFITKGVDYNFALTWDGYYVKLYINGVYNNGTSYGTAFVKNATTLAIGGLVGATGEYFKGYISEILLFNRALNASEVSLIADSTPRGTNNYVMGYYDSWKAQHGFTPDKLAVDKLDFLYYAFANISDTYEVTIGDPVLDATMIPAAIALKSVNPNLKVIVSVGGFGWSEKFSDTALTAPHRATFAASCIAYCLQYGFDGVDIDWEYPVSGGDVTNVYRPEDKQNYTLLIQAIHSAFTAQTVTDGKKYYLTIAYSAGVKMANIEAAAVAQYLDWVNIMAYDMHNFIETSTNFCAPLYMDLRSGTARSSTQLNIDDWLNAGVPPSKLIIGIPMYGFYYTNVNPVNSGLYSWYSTGELMDYKVIASTYLTNDAYSRSLYEPVQVPYLYGNNKLITYDDPESIRAKVNHIKGRLLGGIMCWSLTMDDDNHTLLKAMYDAIKL